MKLALALSGITVAMVGCAAGPAGADHAAHHPAAAVAPAPAHGQMDAMMKSMHAMHERIMAAKTPEERSRLMQEHMKLMHEGMGMMGRRMDMMERMMQTMMEREATKPPAAPQAK